MDKVIIKGRMMSFYQNASDQFVLTIIHFNFASTSSTVEDEWMMLEERGRKEVMMRKAERH